MPEKAKIYLDHAATTYVDERVKKEMEKYFSEEFGNPGSFNSAGFRAKEAVDNARQRVANVLGGDSDEIIFTGSGTEANNLAIKGVALALRNRGKHIITTRVEHESILEPCKYLEKEEGFEISYAKADKHGMADLDDLKSKLRKDTVLISIIYANNEIGTVNDIAKIGEIAKGSRILLHTDACQAGGLLDINVNRLNVDLMTLNGSKLYAPKGIGMLYVKRGTPIKPIIHGGGQEKGLRSGTENVPGIVGFAKALEICDSERKSESERLKKLRDKLIEGMLKVQGSFLNGHPTERLPNNANITFQGTEAEALLLHLDEKGILASSGSACTTKKLEPSHVLLAIGLSAKDALATVRFTLGRKTREENIDFVIKTVPPIVERLREVVSKIYLETKPK